MSIIHLINYQDLILKRKAILELPCQVYMKVQAKINI
jgi:hypothetical protein